MATQTPIKAIVTQGVRWVGLLSRSGSTPSRYAYDAVMAANDPWKRYLDAGFELTKLTRARAETAVRDLMKAGEVQREEAQERVEELLDRSRRATEAVVELVRDEVTRQLKALGITSGRAKPAPAKAAAKAAAKTPAKAAGGAKKAKSKATGPAKKPAKKATKKATGTS